MAKPRKLPSGRWNLQLYDYTDDAGRRHYKSFTADTKAEVVYQGSLWQTNRTPHEDKPIVTVGEAIDNYIKLSEVLSPATLSSYKRMRHNTFQSIMDLPITELTNAVLQNAINMEAKRKTPRGEQVSAKYVKNSWGLVTAALKTADPNFNPRVKLPKYQKHIKDYPDPKVILKAIKGTNIELPCLLAMWLSFTMSEVRGLKYRDISNGCITINRTKVCLEGGDIVKDNAKVETRLRKNKLPEYIAKLIPPGEPDEYIIKETSGCIYKRLQRICKREGITPISFHDLRHYSASIALFLKIPDKYIMERGGWKTPNVMKSVYQTTFSSEREATDAIMDSWFMKNL